MCVFISKTGLTNSALADADAQAKKDVTEAIAKFKTEDIQALGLAETFRFSWGCVRRTDPFSTNLFGPMTTIGEFRWNMD